VATRVYRIVVEGQLSDRMGSAFEGMTLVHQEGTTAITGPVRDQAHLQGLMQRVADLGLVFVSAAPAEQGGEATDDPKGAR